MRAREDDEGDEVDKYGGLAVHEMKFINVETIGGTQETAVKFFNAKQTRNLINKCSNERDADWLSSSSRETGNVCELTTS